MRLKIIFTPLAFLVAIIIAIWYIWPTVQEIQLKRKEIAASKVKLEGTQKKKQNVEYLKNALDKNKEKENFILSYLPTRRNEERIINALDSLATDSGIKIKDISLGGEKESAPATPTTESAFVSNPTIIGTPANPDGTVPVPSRPEPQMKIFSAKLNFSGKYNNIKIFLAQIYKMELFNKINSLSIKNGSSEEGGDSEILTADIEVTFGYLPEIQEVAGNPSGVFSESNFNFSPYDSIVSLSNTKIPVLILEEGQRGKENPFLP